MPLITNTLLNQIFLNFKLSPDWIEEIRASIPALANERKEKYINEYGITNYDATIIVKEKKCC